jgi:hypothetical protein
MASAKPAHNPKASRRAGLWTWQLARCSLRDPARTLFFNAKLMQHWRPSRPARVKLEFSADHHNDAWMISGFETHVSQCFCSSDKETAAQTPLISNHPIAAAISTDHKDLWPLTRRRFAFRCLFHLDVSDLLGSFSLVLP